MPGVLTQIETLEKLSIIEYVEIQRGNSVQVEDDDAAVAHDENKWGFQITGGINFGMPITVFHVRCFSLGFSHTYTTKKAQIKNPK